MPFQQAILNDIWKGQVTGSGASYSAYRQSKVAEAATGNNHNHFNFG